VRRRDGYEKVTHTDLLVKICAAALGQHPRVNATWTDGGIVLQADVNVGIAVATDEALIVPVIHGADNLRLREVADRRRDLVARARGRKLRPDDIAAGTFTISNLGMFGVRSFTAIVDPPQTAILAVGAVRRSPVEDATGGVVFRDVMTLTLSCDHRVVYGADGARFLSRLRELLERPLVLAL
jgi:pyruvate dehydrogenase E2 component (dihydrolipoamide acetyltransferase)